MKVEPGPRDPGPLDPGTRNPEPPSRFKSGTEDHPQILKAGAQDLLQSLKVGPPHLSLMNSFFSEYFFAFFTYLFLCLF